LAICWQHIANILAGYPQYAARILKKSRESFGETSACLSKVYGEVWEPDGYGSRRRPGGAYF